MTQPKPYCFVLMPFLESFDDIYALGIKGACDDVGVYCERVDEQIFDGSVLDRIYNQISKANVIVADMTNMNPNVFYEVGYAHAIGKRTILLTQKAEDIPFDLKHFPHIVYGEKITTLRTELSKRVRKFAFQTTNQKQYELGVEVYWQRNALSQGIVEVIHSDKISPGGTFTLHNESTITYRPKDLSFGIETVSPFSRVWFSDEVSATPTSLPNGKYIHMVELDRALFPGAYCNFAFELRSPLSLFSESDKTVIKIFSVAGSRDFPFLFKHIPDQRG